MARPRREVDQLLRQARRDLMNAGKNIDIEAYEVTAFLCHQSVEKGLKALYVHARRKRPPPTHALHEIGAELSAPSKLLDLLKGLSPDYAISRYPDAANGVPGEIYTKAVACSKLAAAKEVWSWIDPQL